jgi:hypothetical protein
MCIFPRLPMGYEGLKGAIHRYWSKEENCRVQMGERERQRPEEGRTKDGNGEHPLDFVTPDLSP